MKTVVRQKRNAQRRNGSAEEAAAQMSEAFHGRPAHEIRDYEGVRIERNVLADLGRLISLTVKIDGEQYVLRPLGVRVSCDPDGRQLYLVGGDQAAELAQLGIDGDLLKDHVDFGQLRQIEYFTRKGFHNFEPTTYWHRFGEVSGIRPTLHYDSLNELLYLTGGHYRVKPEGIVD